MTTSFVAVMLLGLVLGMRHATDPDHVIAVTTFVARQRSALGAAAIGAAWGLGHTLTIFVVGSGIIVFGWVIPPRVGLSTELVVGLMLIVLGVISIVRAAREIRQRAEQHHASLQVHSHAHAHGDYVHTHPHGHDPEAHPHGEQQTPLGWLDRHFASLRPYRLSRPLMVGVVHGLAGSAAVALLVVAAISSPSWGVLYLLVFGLGTIVGMMLMTAAIVLPFAYTENRFVQLSHGLRVASGIVSVAFGLFLAWRIIMVDGLFTDSPRWTPE